MSYSARAERFFSAVFSVFFPLIFFLTLNSCSSNRLAFLDAGGGRHSLVLDKRIAPSEYKKENFVLKGQVMSYEDENYYSRLGVDISRQDGRIDWRRLKAWGADFVILRVGYRGYVSGKVTVDQRFHENIKGALAAGFDVGVYFFSQAVSEEEAVEEAECVIENLKDYEITLPVVFDPEHILWDESRTDNMKKSGWTKNALAFCRTVERAGYTPMIYMNMLWQSDKLDLAKLSAYDFWFADYEKIPQTPYRWKIWQYTCMALADGVNVPEDKNCLVDLDIMILPK